jgi:hypothetical protein
MDTHKNARLTPKGREEMVRAVVHGGLGKAVAARKYNTTRKTVGAVCGLRARLSLRPIHRIIGAVTAVATNRCTALIVGAKAAVAPLAGILCAPGIGDLGLTALRREDGDRQN